MEYDMKHLNFDEEDEQNRSANHVEAFLLPLIVKQNETIE